MKTFIKHDLNIHNETLLLLLSSSSSSSSLLLLTLYLKLEKIYLTLQKLYSLIYTNTEKYITLL